jgi:hypothetical protein
MILEEMSKEQRQSHIDLQTPCQTDRCYKYYRKALIDFSGIKPDRTWSACHLCENYSHTHKPCRNPLHLYWGTNSENQQDICPTTGLTVAQKIGAAHKGKKRTDETKAKMSAASKGKPKSEEHKANLSAVQKGKSPANKGKTMLDEQKAKISAAMKATLAKKKELKNG